MFGTQAACLRGEDLLGSQFIPDCLTHIIDVIEILRKDTGKKFPGNSKLASSTVTCVRF